jgi:TusA-related sulfurtransferase
MDHGDTAQFKVLQLGGGECAGAAQGLVSANFSEAAHERNYRDAFVSQRKYEAAIDCAEQVLRLVGQSLLFSVGREMPASLEEMAVHLRESLTQSNAFIDRLDGILGALGQQKEDFEEPVFRKLVQEMDAWMVEAGQVCQGIDKQLDLSASLQGIAGKGGGVVVDLSSFACPLHYIKARNELKKYQAGDVVDFLFAAGESQQVSSSLQNDGHQILAVEQQGNTTRIKIQKAAS